MLWFPGSNMPGVTELADKGMSYGLVLTPGGLVRVWHGDDVSAVNASGQATVTPGAAHAAAEAAFALAASPPPPL